MSLQITTEPLEDRQLAVTIEVDQQRVDNELRKAARKLARDYRIPGFRKGKAPYNIIVQYLGPQVLYNEFLDELGQEVFKEAVEEEEFVPYAQASLDDISLDPVTYKLTVPLEPEIDLGDYRSIRVEEEPVEVDETEVTERLESYRTQYAGWEDTDRPSEYGDMMNMDARSVIAASDEGEEEIVVLNETDWDVTPSEESPMEPPGFDEALLGMTPGEEKAFELAWPEESQSIHAGKTAAFTVTLNNNQSYEKPALDDELAQLVGPDFETLDDLMANIRETLREQAQTAADNAYLDSAFSAVLEGATLSYPPAVVEDQIDSMISDLEQRLRQFGIEDIDAYFEQSGQTMEAYRDSIRESATNMAERNLIISELWQVEKITATDEDVEEKIAIFVSEPDENDEDAVANAEGMAEMFRSGGGRSILEAQIVQEKAIARLLDIVRGEEVPDLDAIEDDKDDVELAADAEIVAEAEAEDQAAAEETSVSETSVDETSADEIAADEAIEDEAAADEAEQD